MFYILTTINVRQKKKNKKPYERDIPTPEAPIREHDVVCITVTAIAKQRRRRPCVLSSFVEVSFPNDGFIITEEEKLKIRDLARIRS